MAKQSSKTSQAYAGALESGRKAQQVLLKTVSHQIQTLACILIASWFWEQSLSFSKSRTLIQLLCCKITTDI